MKTSVFVLASLFSVSAFAGTQVKCTSASYEVKTVSSLRANESFASYSINGAVVNGAEIVATQYLSPRHLAVSLKVDDQDNAIEVVADAVKKNIYQGKIFRKKSAQTATCVVSYVVTADDRDDGDNR